jgi:type I restriction enzyme S subunit
MSDDQPAKLPAPHERVALPAGWAWAVVEDVGHVQLGRQRSPKNHTGPHMRPYLRVANVYEARIDTSDVLEMNFDPADYERYKLEPGDVLLNEGQSKELVGRPAIYRGEVPGACFQNTLVRFSPRPGITSEWALAVFRLYLHDGTFQSIARWTTNIAHLGAQRFAGLDFPVVPTSEAERITAVLDSYLSRLDDVVATLERVQRNLKRYRASVLKAAVEGRLVPTEAELARKDGRDYEPADALLQRILEERKARSIEDAAEKARTSAEKKAKKAGKPWSDADGQAALEKGRKAATKKYEEPEPPDTSELPELPEGWCWTTVDAVGDVLLGRQRAPQYLTGKCSRPYLRVANIKDDRIDFDDVKEMDFDHDHFEKYRLEPGDILVSEGQSPELVGQSAIYRGGIPELCFQKTLHRFRSVPGGPSPEYAQVVFRAHVKNQVFKKVASITTNIAHLTLIKFKQSRFPLAPRAEQERIAAEVDRLLSVADATDADVARQLVRAVRLRQSILKWAFEGRLVDQDPDDEPATVLLERISAEREKAEAKNGKKKRRQKARKKKTTA